MKVPVLGGVAVLALALLATSASAGGIGHVVDRKSYLAAGNGPVVGLMRASPRATALFASGLATAQDSEAVEETLGLDRPMRRLIQQGLRNEGVDAGAPDGLFGPRTRDAIRRWQQARGVPATGYLDGAQAAALRAASAAPSVAPDVAESVATPVTGNAAPSIVEVPPGPAEAPVKCDGWNTEEFFETATVDVVTACLAAGADVAARDDDGFTPLHRAALSSEHPTVIEALLVAGADLEARSDIGRTPLHLAAWNENPAVIEALLAAGADVEAPNSDDEACRRTDRDEAPCCDRSRGRTPTPRSQRPR